MTYSTLPISSNALTGVTTQGVNGTAAVPTSGSTPFMRVSQVKVYCSAKCYVAFGNGSTASTTPPAAKAIQQAATEEVYTIPYIESDPVYTYIWIYSLSSTIDADVSWFG